MARSRRACKHSLKRSFSARSSGRRRSRHRLRDGLARQHAQELGVLRAALEPRFLVVALAHPCEGGQAVSVLDGRIRAVLHQEPGEFDISVDNAREKGRGPLAVGGIDIRAVSHQQLHRFLCEQLVHVLLPGVNDDRRLLLGSVDGATQLQEQLDAFLPARLVAFVKGRQQRRPRRVRQLGRQGRSLGDRRADALGVAAVDGLGQGFCGFGVPLGDFWAVDPDVAAQAGFHRLAGYADHFKSVFGAADFRHGSDDLEVLAQARHDLFARLAFLE